MPVLCLVHTADKTRLSCLVLSAVWIRYYSSFGPSIIHVLHAHFLNYCLLHPCKAQTKTSAMWTSLVRRTWRATRTQLFVHAARTGQLMISFCRRSSSLSLWHRCLHCTATNNTTHMKTLNGSRDNFTEVNKTKGPYTLTSFLVPVAGASFWCQLPADE